MERSSHHLARKPVSAKRPARFPSTPTRQAQQRPATAHAVEYPYRLACFLQSLTYRRDSGSAPIGAEPRTRRRPRSPWPRRSHRVCRSATEGNPARFLADGPESETRISLAAPIESKPFAPLPGYETEEDRIPTLGLLGYSMSSPGFAGTTSSWVMRISTISRTK